MRNTMILVVLWVLMNWDPFDNIINSNTERKTVLLVVVKIHVVQTWIEVSFII